MVHPARLTPCSVVVAVKAGAFGRKNVTVSSRP